MKTKLLALAAAAALSAPAFADTVNNSGFTFTPAKPVSVASPNYSSNAGQFTGTLNGNSFLTYCTDLLQSFSFNVNYTNYSVVDGVTAWGATRRHAMDKLMSAAIASGVPSDAAQSAAVQAAVWEVLYETSGVYDLTAGTFVATSTDGATQGFINAVNWAGIMAGPVTHHVDQLYSPTKQDFLVITEVPEPSTYALLVAGLAGVGFVARRRSAKA
ncbi:MAG: PEP-CTERM sorting domain-containing protein [Aquabacterium sp.]